MHAWQRKIYALQEVSAPPARAFLAFAPTANGGGGGADRFGGPANLALVQHREISRLGASENWRCPRISLARDRMALEGKDMNDAVPAGPAVSALEHTDGSLE